jgi:hypothetical protein
MNEGNCDVHRNHGRFTWARRITGDIIAHPSWRMVMNSFRSAIAELEDESCECSRFGVPAGLEEEIRALEENLPDLS